jgi:hypothetical protein
MITIYLDPNSKDKRLWQSYVDVGYSKCGHPGFRAYVTAIVPGSHVIGTTVDGLTLKFDNESDYTMFALRWL